MISVFDSLYDFLVFEGSPEELMKRGDSNIGAGLVLMILRIIMSLAGWWVHTWDPPLCRTPGADYFISASWQPYDTELHTSASDPEDLGCPVEDQFIPEHMAYGYKFQAPGWRAPAPRSAAAPDPSTQPQSDSFWSKPTVTFWASP